MYIVQKQKRSMYTPHILYINHRLLYSPPHALTSQLWNDYQLNVGLTRVGEATLIKDKPPTHRTQTHTHTHTHIA